MIHSSNLHNANQFEACGTKAWNLARLTEAGFRCPPFLCIAKSDLNHTDRIRDSLKEAGIRPPFSVRSSADLEDQAESSFAGQFSTFLDVSEENLGSCIQKCFESASAPGVKAMKSRIPVPVPAVSMHVIIQEMIPAELSGVFFTQNPMGILSEAVIVVGAGTGINVVEDRVPTTAWYDNRTDGVSYQTSQPGAPLLPDKIHRELLENAEKLEEIFGAGLDVEYAVAGDILWFLQVRKITTLRRTEKVILDNSNIVESYPGITLPLTADFVTRQYGNIFKGVMTRLLGSQEVSRMYRNIFDHMTECYNGRMYYRIEHWYGVIGFLPFSRKIVPLWQEMLGVRKEDAADSPMRANMLQKFSVALHTLYYFFRSPAKMARLNRDFLQIEQKFGALKDVTASLASIREFYDEMEATVMGKWDYTLINDMYTFLHTGIFRWLMRKKGTEDSEIQAMLSKITHLASLKPVRELLSLSLLWKYSGDCPEFKIRMEEYLKRYGDRSVGELKLETETFRESPGRLMEQILQYEEMPAQELEALIQSLGEPAQECKIPECGRLAGYFLCCARAGIENRELSRLNRTRLFGFARTLFLRAGKLLVEEGRLESERDVFYLTMDEVFGESERNSEPPQNSKVKPVSNPIQDLKILVQQRKFIYDSYAEYPAYTRVVFDGAVVSKPCLDLPLKTSAIAGGLLRGTPCSPGKVTGEVLMADGALPQGSTAGKILVTRSTDPGWAFLLAPAAGLVSEQGSLLSHTAIIARELRIPALVGVRGAVSALRDGDMVELDCELGIVRRLS